jgi:hypothetical protein
MQTKLVVRFFGLANKKAKHFRSMLYNAHVMHMNISE